MAPKRKTVSTPPSDSIPTARDANGSKIEMRPYYGAKDLKYVQYLVYSTYYDKVPRGVKLLLLSPWVGPPYLAWLAAVVFYLPNQLVYLGWTPSMILGARAVLAFAGIVLGLACAFYYVDRNIVSERVIEALDNDLKDPGEYYRQDQGNFWVLTVNDVPVGCIGMDHHQSDVVKHQLAPETTSLADSEAIRQAKWKRTAYILARIDDAMRITVSTTHKNVKKLLFGPDKPESSKILFPAHKPYEASVRRLAIKANLQDRGLSTPLLKRVAFWAHSHQVEYLYAETDELQPKMEQVLQKRHGYELVSRKRIGLFQQKSVWRLDVKLWMSKELEAREKQRREEEFLKEQEELKEYE